MNWSVGKVNKKFYSIVVAVVVGFCAVLCFPLYAEDEGFITTIITDTECSFCSTEATEKILKQVFPGIAVNKLDYRDDKAQVLITHYDLAHLPIFLVPRGLSESKNFFQIKNSTIEKDDTYIVLKKELGGVFRFLDRKEIPKRIDVFVTIYDSEAGRILKQLKEFSDEKKIKFFIHFIPSAVDTSKQKDKREALAAELAELEELKRIMAVKKLYPKKFFGYLLRRLSSLGDTWWMLAMDELGIDAERIKKLSSSGRIEKMLIKNTALARELGIYEGVVVLINNNQVFRAFNINDEALAKIMDEVL